MSTLAQSDIAAERQPLMTPEVADGRAAIREDSRPGRALMWIIVLGALVRVILWLAAQGQTPQIVDEKTYSRLAVNLVERGEFSVIPGEPISERPPLYPALVALVYSAFGLENYQAVRLLQAVVSLGMVLLVYRLGVALYSRRTALWAAGLCCFYPSFLGYNNLLLTEVLFTFLLVAFCVFVSRALQERSLGTLAVAGLFLGLAALARSVVWIFPPILAGYFLFAWQGRLRGRVAAGMVLLTTFAMTITPWTIRNTRLQQTFVTVDVMGGRNLMMGNYRFTPLYRSWAAIGIEGEQSWWRELFRACPDADHSTQGKIDKLAMRHGLAFMRENPGLTLKRDIVKFFDFWGLERELIAGLSRGFFGRIDGAFLFPLALAVMGSYALALFAGIFGLCLAPPSDWRSCGFLILLVVFVCGMHTLVFGHSRYHLPLMPFFFLFAGAMIDAGNPWRHRARWPFWLAGGICSVLVVGWVWLFLAVDFDLFVNAVSSSS